MIGVISPSRKPHNRASLCHSIKPTELQRVPKPNKSKSINKPSLQYRESRNKKKNMERKEDQQEEEEDIVCLDESFFINDK